MRVAIVVNRFPVLSESFVIRLIESMHERGIKIVIVALEGVDRALLEQLSPVLICAEQDGSVELRHEGDFYHARQRMLLARIRWTLTAFILNPLQVFGRIVSGVSLRNSICASTFGRLMRGVDVDLVHTQFMTVACSVVANAGFRKSGVPMVSYARGYDVTQTNALSAGELRLLKRRDGLTAVTCVSGSLSERVIDLGFSVDRVHVVHAGIPIARFPFVAPSLRNNSGLHLIQVGRFVDKKGYDLSLRMLANLDDCGAELTIIGDGPLKQDLVNTASSLGVLNRVSFLGSLGHAETLEIVGRADVMLVPSRVGADGDSEGIPNVLKEAMALGVICVGSTHSGIPELLEDGVTGFVFQEGSVEAFVASMRSAISKRLEWDEIALAARRSVIDGFDSSAVAEQLHGFYKAVLSNQRLA